MIEVNAGVYPALMDYENFRYHVDNLYNSDHETVYQALITIKNSVIGSNKQKGSVIAQGLVPRLIQLLNGIDNVPVKIRVQATIILGSLALGTSFHLQSLADVGLISALMNVLNEMSNDSDILNADKSQLISACLRCLRSLAQHNYYPPLDEPKLLLKFARPQYKIDDRSNVATILAAACVSAKEQDALCATDAARVLTSLLGFAPNNLLENALKFTAAFCKEHLHAAIALDEAGATEILSNLIQRVRPAEIQLGASKCLSHMYRANALQANDPRLVMRALPCLARLCHREHPIEIRTEAADTLAYLTEVDTELQKIASISYHLIAELADLLTGDDVGGKKAAFKGFASVGANDEDIRKKIIDTSNLMGRVVQGLSHEDAGVRLAAVRCLHSLSRSVQLLRTTFQDHCVWQPLMAMISSQPPPELELLTVVSSTLCNLLLEFSPAKEPILGLGALKLLCDLTERPEAALRLNGVWALMNMAFQAELKVKQQILTNLGTDRVFRLLTDSDTQVIMKTLGLLRNTLSLSHHIDLILANHATSILQAIVLVLESHHGPEVKEQAICTLGNIADGDDGRIQIANNDDVLKKLIHYMMHSDARLAAASLFCFQNLIRANKPGYLERRNKLKSLCFVTFIKQLCATSDPLIQEKAKAVLEEFGE